MKVNRSQNIGQGWLAKMEKLETRLERVVRDQVESIVSMIDMIDDQNTRIEKIETANRRIDRALSGLAKRIDAVGGFDEWIDCVMVAGGVLFENRERIVRERNLRMIFDNGWSAGRAVTHISNPIYYRDDYVRDEGCDECYGYESCFRHERKTDCGCIRWPMDELTR